jgi:hypothetical protein
VPRVVLRNRGQGGGDRQFAAFGHGVAGVDGQVHDDLFEHAGVGFDARQIRQATEFQRDVLAEQARKHVRHIAKDRVQLDEFRLEHLFAAEQQQLADERGGALGRGGDLFQ